MKKPKMELRPSDVAFVKGSIARSQQYVAEIQNIHGKIEAVSQLVVDYIISEYGITDPKEVSRMLAPYMAQQPANEETKDAEVTGDVPPAIAIKKAKNAQVIPRKRR